MSRFLTTLPLVALMALAGPGFAQETATPSDAAATDGTVTKPAIEDQLSMGTDAESSVVGQPYIQEEVDDWSLQCVKTEDGNDPCQLYQLLDDAEGNSVAEISMFRLPAGGKAVAGATIIVPLETLLTEQLTIAVGEGKGKRYPFAFCNPIGCYARIGLTAEDIDAFKRGSKATVTIVPFVAPDQKVVVDLSLKGFTKGFDMTSVIDN